MKLTLEPAYAFKFDFIGAGFLKDLLEQFDASCPTHRPIFNIALCYDLSQPSNRIPFKAYYDAIEWLISTYGEGYLIELGKRIGRVELLSMWDYGLISQNPKAEELFNALSMVMNNTNRACDASGLQLIGEDEKTLLLQIDFPYNPLLIHGLLHGLMEAAGYCGVDVLQTSANILEVCWKSHDANHRCSLYDEIDLANQIII